MTALERVLLAHLERDPFDDVVVSPAARRYLDVFDGWPARGSERLRAEWYLRLRRGQAIGVARRNAVAAARRSNVQLSGRQKDVLRVMLRGLDRAEAAAELGISENSVKTHLRGVATALNTSSRFRWALFAIGIGLLEDE